MPAKRRCTSPPTGPGPSRSSARSNASERSPPAADAVEPEHRHYNTAGAAITAARNPAANTAVRPAAITESNQKQTRTALTTDRTQQ